MVKPLRFQPLVAMALLWLLGSPALAGGPAGTISDGLTALYQGNYRLAESISRAWVKQHPRSAAGRILRGQVLMGTGRFEQAFLQFRQAHRLEPDNLDALYFLGKVSLILGQVEFDQLRRMAPNSARVHQLLGEAYRVQEKSDQAEREFLLALKKNPKLIEVLDELGDMKRADSECKQAMSYYRRAAAIDPNDYTSVYGMGACYMLDSRYEPAIRLFERAVKIDPRSAAARFALGRALMSHQELEKALVQFKKTIALDPSIGQSYFLMGRLYRQLGREREAKEAFRKAQQRYRADWSDTEPPAVSPKPGSPGQRVRKHPSPGRKP